MLGTKDRIDIGNPYIPRFEHFEIHVLGSHELPVKKTDTKTRIYEAWIAAEGIFPKEVVPWQEPVENPLSGQPELRVYLSETVVPNGVNRFWRAINPPPRKRRR